jgi:hypothetical protein
MPKKEKPDKSSEEGVLVSTAKAIGTAAGKVAKLVGATGAPHAGEPAVSQKVPKLSKKDKHRLPRKEKKALQKRSK